MHTAVRLYRTAAGKLVEHGHVDAVVLAYGENDEVAADDQAAAAKLQPKADHTPKQGGDGDGDHTPKAEANPTPKRNRSPRKRAATKPKA